MHWHSLLSSPIGNIFRKLITRYYLAKIKNNGRALFKDRFGLKYYIYPDMRLSSTIDRGVRTDDEGVLYLIQKLIQHLPKDRPICGLDLGAYVGIISLFLAKSINTRGHVHAFEAEPQNFNRLQENIGCNRFTNVTPHHLAMWSETSQKVYSRRDPDSGMSDVQPSPKKQGTPVSTTTIDSFLAEQNISTIDILKLDVEGSEPEVLKGAYDTLKRNAITFLIFEYIQQESGQQICDILTNSNYHLYWIHRSGQISPLTDEVKNSQSWGNCLAIAPTHQHLDQLPHLSIQQ